MIRMIATVIILGLVSGCSVSPPRNAEDICAIFNEKDDWHEPAREAAEEYGTSVPVMMSMMYQESSFRSDARPPFRWWFIIPLGRASSAYGYAQAKDETWDWYTDRTGRVFAERDEFDDAIRFMGWYNAYTYQRNGVRRDDAYGLYLAYHEGHGGYERGTFRQKGWLMNVAGRVQDRAARYARQYSHCRKQLEDNEGGWF